MVPRGRRFASQGTPSIIGVRHGRIANTCHPRPSEHHQTDHPQERPLRAVHHPESGQRTPFDGKCCHISLHGAYSRKLVLQLKSTKQLLGRAGERFLLFGMLIHSKEGKLCLEDLDGVVELDFSQLVRDSLHIRTLCCSNLTLRFGANQPGSTERRAVHGRVVGTRGRRLHRKRDVERDRDRAPALRMQRNCAVREYDHLSHTTAFLATTKRMGRQVDIWAY